MSKSGGFKQVKHKAGSRGRNRKPGSAPKFSGKKGLTLWDQASRWYDSLVGGQGTDFQKDIIMPGVFRLLEVRKKDRVLDLACGILYQKYQLGSLVAIVRPRLQLQEEDTHRQRRQVLLLDHKL